MLDERSMRVSKWSRKFEDGCGRRKELALRDIKDRMTKQNLQFIILPIEVQVSAKYTEVRSPLPETKNEALTDSPPFDVL
jgi:hypothetical protein